ncbi:MAG TPA: CPBP family intramembrane glutamic endopeptidase [Gemmataceae bacterium]|nr:CPBP family intramembrane glutamic endopeptidase [Gemmataceae bacterium]
MNDWQEIATLTTVYFAVAVVGVVLLGRRLAFRRPSDVPLLPLQRSQFTSWHGIDVLVAFLILQVIPGLVAETLLKAEVFEHLYGVDVDKAIRGRGQLLAVALASPLVIGLVILGLRQLRGTRLSEFGITPARAGANITVGFWLWLVVTPPALAIFFIAVLLTPEGYADEHFIGQLTEQQLAAWEWVLFFIVAVVLAPVLEEVVFRGILLPWQLQGGWEAQAIVAFCSIVVATMSGFRSEDKPYHVGPVIFVMIMLASAFAVLYFWFGRHIELQALPATQAVEVPNAAERLTAVPPPDASSTVSSAELHGLEAKLAALFGNTSTRPLHAALAVYTNGLLFAAFHSAAWPSPIPLLLVGVALAWVRYRTSSLVGAVTLHALFNAVSGLALFWKHALA